MFFNSGNIDKPVLGKFNGAGFKRKSKQKASQCCYRQQPDLRLSAPLPGLTRKHGHRTTDS
jgi:hypothetical protein